MPIDFKDFKRLMAKFGITDLNFLASLYAQLINADSINGDALEFAVSVINDIKPNNQLEVMLAARMATMHLATMKLIA